MTARRDAAIDTLIRTMAKGRKRKPAPPAGGARKEKLTERERTLRAAWMGGQVNARHAWKRRPPRSYGRDVERARFFYCGYDAMKMQRMSGRGVRLMVVPDCDQVEARYPTDAHGRPRAQLGLFEVRV